MIRVTKSIGYVVVVESDKIAGMSCEIMAENPGDMGPIRRFFLSGNRLGLHGADEARLKEAAHLLDTTATVIENLNTAHAGNMTMAEFQLKKF